MAHTGKAPRGPKRRVAVPDRGGHARLRTLFRALARAAVASSMGAAVGCASHSLADQLDPGGHGGGGVSAGMSAGSGAGGSGAGGTSAGDGLVGGSGAAGSGSAGLSAGSGAGGTSAGSGSAGTVAGMPIAGMAQPPEPEPPANPWVSLPCPFNPFANLEGTGLAHDYAAMIDGPMAYYGMLQSPGRLMFENGTECDPATVSDSCTEEMRMLRADCLTGPPECPGRYVVTIEGDSIRLLGTRAELVDAITPLQRPELAALLAAYDGREVTCTKSEDPSSLYRRVEDGYLIRSELDACEHTGYSDNGVWMQELHVGDDGEISVVTDKLLSTGGGGCPVPGRRPAGLLPWVRSSARDLVGRFFAEAAHFEAASVFAFEQLGRDLAALGAPPELLRQAQRAAADEVRHARSTARLARRFGARPPSPRIETPARRSAFEIALENAVEGCVREAHAALVATYQALRARDPEIRRVMAGIAEDETRHASLSFAVARFLEPRLSDRERDAVQAARRAELRALARELQDDPAPALQQLAGLPDGRAARHMLAGLAFAA